MTAPPRFALKLEDGAFTDPVAGLRLPDRELLVAEYVLGGTEAATIRNRANPSLPLTVQGTGMTYNAHSVTVRSGTAGHGYLTGIKPDEEHTLIVVRKPSVFGAAATSRFIFMTGVSAGLWGVRQFTDNYFSMGETATNQGAHRTIPAAGTIFFEAGVCSVPDPQRLIGGLGTMYYYSGGVQQSVVSDTINVIQRTEYTTYNIAGTAVQDSVTTNDFEVFFVAIYNKPLTPAGVDDAYQNIVAYYADLGVTVV